MNTSELRIGNIVQHKTNKGVVNVIHVLENHIGYHNKLLSMKCIDALASNFVPIPLDEDWLLRFGFEKYKFDNGEPNQYRYKSRLIVIRDGKFTDYGSSVILEYVHQLQNLYFALVGEELVLQD
jgi:hypothetical protein